MTTATCSRRPVQRGAPCAADPRGPGVRTGRMQLRVLASGAVPGERGGVRPPRGARGGAAAARRQRDTQPAPQAVCGRRRAAHHTLLFVRLLERMRRATAIEFGVPLRSLSPRQAFISRVLPHSDPERASIHADECSVPGYHYSAVLYLSTSVEALQADQAGAVTAGEAARAAHAAEADFAGGELRFYGREQTPTRTRPARPCLRWCCRGAGRRLSSRRAGRTCTRWPASPPASATHFPPSLRPNSPRRPLRGGLISGAARPSAAPPVRRRCGSSG